MGRVGVQLRTLQRYFSGSGDFSPAKKVKQHGNLKVRLKPSLPDKSRCDFGVLFHTLVRFSEDRQIYRKRCLWD